MDSTSGSSLDWSVWKSAFEWTPRQLSAIRLASITDLAVARRILSHLGLPDRPPSSAPPRPPPVLDFAASNPAD
jgi:hypothetical protein